MELDPVLAEIRAFREAYAAKFGGDIGAMLADLRKRQEEGGRPVVSLPPKRPLGWPGLDVPTPGPNVQPDPSP
jgi:hypothetical protein